mgnify:CR=1 FL=1
MPQDHGSALDIVTAIHVAATQSPLHMMQDLAAEYGAGRTFKDEELFPKIVSLTYPSVGEFLKKYVAGDTPIPYDEFFERMGVEKTMIDKSGNPTGEMDNNQAKGITAEECARQILAGIAAGKDEFGVGGKEMRALFLHRYFPKMFKKILKRQAAR